MDTRVWVLGLLAVVRLGSVGAQEQVYFADGGKLNLKPTIPADSNPLNSVLWKFGTDMVAEWVEALGPVEYYGPFLNRTSLNSVTGQLEINKLTSSDSGVYSVELNGKLQSETYNVKVIWKVPKPTVSRKPLTCSSTSDSCTLSCDGEIAKAEPITYSWRRDGGDWEQSSKLMQITKDDNDVKNFYCQMKNPVSVEESQPEKNPFYQAGSSNGIVGGVIGSLILICGVGICCWKREAIREKCSSLCKGNANKGESAPLNEPAGTKTSGCSSDVEQANHGESAPLNEPAGTTTLVLSSDVEQANHGESAPLNEPAGNKTSGSSADEEQANHTESAHLNEPANHGESAPLNEPAGNKTSGSSADEEQGNPPENVPQTEDGESDGKTT